MFSLGRRPFSPTPHATDLHVNGDVHLECFQPWLTFCTVACSVRWKAAQRTSQLMQNGKCKGNWKYLMTDLISLCSYVIYKQVNEAQSIRSIAWSMRNSDFSSNREHRSQPHVAARISNFRRRQRWQFGHLPSVRLPVLTLTHHRKKMLKYLVWQTHFKF